MPASRKNDVPSIGVTGDSIKRVWQHRNQVLEAFGKRSAILREQTLKNWKRTWKLRLIEEGNTDGSDLYPTILREVRLRCRRYP